MASLFSGLMTSSSLGAASPCPIGLPQASPGSHSVFGSPAIEPCAFDTLKYGYSGERRGSRIPFLDTINENEVKSSYIRTSSNGSSLDDKKYFVIGLNSTKITVKIDSPPRKSVYSSRRGTEGGGALLHSTIRRNSCMPVFHVGSPVTKPKERNAYSSSEINKEVELTKIIGRGGFGRVYLGLLNEKRVAVKKLHEHSKNSRASLESFQAELQAKTLIHPNIVQVLRVSGEEDKNFHNCYIVMEYVGDKNLKQIIETSKSKLKLQRRLSYALDIVTALEFIHSKNLVHLDVKPSNILVTPWDTCKVGDFGCCQVVKSSTGCVSPTQISYLTGTFAYRAPELLRGSSPSAKADIYSLAISLWQMCSRQIPYNGYDQHMIIFGVVANNLRPNSFAKDDQVCEHPVERALKDLYTQCWDNNPDARLSSFALVEVLTHHFRNNIIET